MTVTSPTLSIVIPCFNEEKNIEALVQRYEKVFQHVQGELVLVNNGSRDNTRSAIEIMAKQYCFVRSVSVGQNRGYGGGIKAGLAAAHGTLIAWSHADLQCDPEDFLKATSLATTLKGDFLIKGSRTNRPFVDSCFTFGMSVFETLLFLKKISDVSAQPSVLQSHHKDALLKLADDFAFDLNVFVYARREGLIIARFPVVFRKRLFGSSSWNTGLAARFKFIKRVLLFSIRLRFFQ